tara:strand:- start:300 stop:863 length:564 start_codon:yes stop_codon:yes gene_type:complete
MQTYSNIVTEIILHKFLIIIVLIGSINYCILALFNYNLIEKISNFFGNNIIYKIIYILIGLSAILLFKRDTFLPFLGHTVYPCNSLKEIIPSNSNTKVKIKTTPNSKIIYWASESNNNIINHPSIAYGKYTNTGIVISDKFGNATLKFRYPSQYKVPYKGLLNRHVHYRICSLNPNGMLSRIETVYL